MLNPECGWATHGGCVYTLELMSSSAFPSTSYRASGIPLLRQTYLYISSEGLLSHNKKSMCFLCLPRVSKLGAGMASGDGRASWPSCEAVWGHSCSKKTTKPSPSNVFSLKWYLEVF